MSLAVMDRNRGPLALEAKPAGVRIGERPGHALLRLALFAWIRTGPVTTS